jgi:multicomponent Na+:H+ antiporter subunit C
MSDFLAAAAQRPNFIAFVALFVWGLYITITHHNIVKKLIGLYLVQTSVTLFLITFAAKEGSTVPILMPGQQPVQALRYSNPLPHALTLTAVVVQVATLGVALALVAGIYRTYNSVDETDILKKLE